VSENCDVGELDHVLFAVLDGTAENLVGREGRDAFASVRSEDW